MHDELGLYAQATKLGFENAERWVNDAKLLIKNASFGHADAMLRFACEEIAKVHVCWLVSEKIIPKENILIQYVFQRHVTKNSVLLGMLWNFSFRWNEHLGKQFVERDFELSDENIDKALQELMNFLHSAEKMRQRAMYVNLNLDKNQVETPLTIGEKEVGNSLLVAEICLRIVKSEVEKSLETDKER